MSTTDSTAPAATTKIEHMVLCFLFRRTSVEVAVPSPTAKIPSVQVAKTEVALVLKAKPDWQAGRYNGIGGHVEDGESYEQAMRREFMEEAGVELPQNLTTFGFMSGPGWVVNLFTAQVEGAVELVQTNPIEPVSWHNVENLPPNKIGNVAFLVYAAMGSDSLDSVSLAYK